MGPDCGSFFPVPNMPLGLYLIIVFWHAWCTFYMHPEAAWHNLCWTGCSRNENEPKAKPQDALPIRDRKSQQSDANV